MDTFDDEPELGLRNRSTDQVVVGAVVGKKMEPMELGTTMDDDDDDNAGIAYHDDEEDGNNSFLEESGHVMHNIHGNKTRGQQQHGSGSSSFSYDLATITATATSLQRKVQTYLNGIIQPTYIGNMQIFFPDYLETSGWGVLGPQWFGPFCVWLILVTATHFCINRATTLGIGSVILCFVFFAISTFYLTDVSFRDPGICMYKTIPEIVPSTERNHWRWCDFCQGFQPPNGAHCPDCKVCIEGYDHHCVWMGTCIGKRNYRQFVRFNISWLYYLAYVFFWLITFGPLLFNKH